MGIEYNIRFKKPETYDFGAFANRIDNPKDGSGWSAFALEETDDGFYFCDNCWSDASHSALRKVIDEALSCGDSVQIDQD